jgi:hypothetical protein
MSSTYLRLDITVHDGWRAVRRRRLLRQSERAGRTAGEPGG